MTEKDKKPKTAPKSTVAETPNKPVKLTGKPAPAPAGKTAPAEKPTAASKAGEKSALKFAAAPKAENPRRRRRRRP